MSEQDEQKGKKALLMGLGIMQIGFGLMIFGILVVMVFCLVALLAPS